MQHKMRCFKLPLVMKTMWQIPWHANQWLFHDEDADREGWAIVETKARLCRLRHAYAD
jgi:hypothetical protein